MRMTAQHQSDAIWHMHHNVGLMRQQNHGLGGRHLRQCAGKIVDADWAARAAAARWNKRELIAEPREPKRLPGLAQTNRIVFVDRDADTLQGKTA